MRVIIRISANTISFTTKGDGGKGSLEHETYRIHQGMSAAVNLRQALSSSRLSRSGESEATVLIDSPVMLVPEAEYDLASAAATYSHTFSLKTNESVKSTVLSRQGAVAVFAVSNSLVSVIADSFARAEYMPLLCPVWNYMQRNSLADKHRRLSAYFYDKTVAVISFRRNRFSFFNTFDATHTADVVYYILRVWKELGFDDNADSVHIAGDSPCRLAATNGLRQYIKNVVEDALPAQADSSSDDDLTVLPLDVQILIGKGL